MYSSSEQKLIDLSARQDKVILVPRRNREKYVKACRDEERSYAPAFALVDYAARGVRFTVVVYARSRWFVDGDVDGITVMVGEGAEHAHITARITDLPAEIRPVVRNVRAILRYEDSDADKARKKRERAFNLKYMRPSMPERYDEKGDYIPESKRGTASASTETGK